ncbi:MAG: DNA repair protein RadC [Clostridiales bacterium]|nr:DNA repair protein RadC [Clostridiales bacterium]
MGNIDNWTINEKPYEKCKEYGPSSLTDSELLAVILRTGSKDISVFELSKKMLGSNSDGKALMKLSEKTAYELMQYPGIGQIKAILLECIFELARRLWKIRIDRPVKFNNPSEIANYYYEDMKYLKVEQVKLLLLNTKGGLIKELTLSSGTVNHCLVSSREILIECLRYEAVNFILIHNHPTGDPAPSIEDIELTKNIDSAACIVGVNLIDHIVIGDHCYVSLKEERYI